MQPISAGSDEPSLKPLSLLSAGTRAIVRELRGGKGLIGRLAALGFTVGAEVTVAQNYGHGPVIAIVRDARIALGRGEADKVWVEPVGIPQHVEHMR